MILSCNFCWPNLRDHQCHFFFLEKSNRGVYALQNIIVASILSDYAIQYFFYIDK